MRVPRDKNKTLLRKFAVTNNTGSQYLHNHRIKRKHNIMARQNDLTIVKESSKSYNKKNKCHGTEQTYFFNHRFLVMTCIDSKKKN